MRGVLISAPSSNQGKTVISVGLLGLLRSKFGQDAIVGAKAGPDYIGSLFGYVHIRRSEFRPLGNA